MPLPWQFLPKGLFDDQQNDEAATSWLDRQRSWLSETLRQGEEARQQIAQRQAEGLSSLWRGLTTDTSAPARQQYAERNEPLDIGRWMQERWEATKQDLSKVGEETRRAAEEPMSMQQQIQRATLPFPGLAPATPGLFKGVEVAARPINYGVSTVIDQIQNPGAQGLDPQRIEDVFTGKRMDTLTEEGIKKGGELTADSPSPFLRSAGPIVGGALGLAADIAVPGPEIGLFGKAAKGARAAEPLAEAATTRAFHGATQPFETRDIRTPAFFTSDREIAQGFAERRTKGAGETNPQPRVIAADLNIQRPYVIDAEGDFAGNLQFGRKAEAYRRALADDSFDGIIIKNTRDEGTLYVVKRSEQVAETTGQQGSIAPSLATTVGGAAAGAGAEAAAFPQKPGESDAAYAARLAAGGLAGGAFGFGGARVAGRIGDLTAARAANTVNPERMAQYYGKEAPLGKSVKQRLDDLWMAYRYQMTDSMAALQRAQEKTAKDIGRPLRGNEMPYRAARLQKGAAAVGEQQLAERFDPIIQKIGPDEANLADFITARHNIRIANQMAERAETNALKRGVDPIRAKQHAERVRQNRMFAGGKTVADEEANLARLKTGMTPERYTDMEKAANQLDVVVDWARQQLVEGQVITADYARTLKAMYPHFVPTKVLDYLDTEGASFSKGRKIGLAETGIKRLTEEGSEKLRENPLASIQRLVMDAAVARSKNETFTYFKNLRDLSPELSASIRKIPDSYTPTNTETVITGFEDGVKARYVLPTELAGLVETSPALPQGLRQFSNAVAAWKHLTTTLKPAFAVGQAPVDAYNFLMRESTTSGSPFDPRQFASIMTDYVKAIPQAFAGIEQGRYYGATADLVKAGGGLGTLTARAPEPLAERLRRAGQKNVFDIRSTADLKALGKQAISLRPIGAVANRVEMIPRTARYTRSLARGDVPAEAAYKSRDLIDFPSGGAASRAINTLVPFFNPAMLGLSSVGRMFKENPKAAREAVITMLAGPVLALELINRRDPQTEKDYEDVSQDIKDQGIVIMWGGASTDPKGNRRPNMSVLRLQQFAPFAIGLREAARAVMGEETRPIAQTLFSMLNEASPVAGTDAAGVAGTLVPPIAKQLGEVALDKSFYTGNKINTAAANERAGVTARAISGATYGGLGALGLRGGVDPAQIQYLMSQVGQGPGQMYLDVERAAEGKPGPGTGPLSDIPIVGGMARRFVRSEIGGQLEQAQENVLPLDVEQQLRTAGITYRPTAVGRDIQGIPLTVEQQTQYQQLTNQQSATLIRQLIAMPEWSQLPAEAREQLVRDMTSTARAVAAATVLGGMDTGYIQRSLPQGVK